MEPDRGVLVWIVFLFKPVLCQVQVVGSLGVFPHCDTIADSLCVLELTERVKTQAKVNGPSAHSSI